MRSSFFLIKNIQLFIAFRILFNARFYYPVFTVLFLDFGLSLEQFATLNTIWAVTIVLLEVPSGALADALGRRNLLRISSALFFFEIAIICFLPLGNNALIFWVFAINRVVSGAAEAFASGADEALAYDSLKEENKSEFWPKVLTLLMRYQSLAFIFALIVGSCVYDPKSINSFLSFAGLNFEVSAQISMRFPLYLMLISSLAAVIVTYKMKEPGFRQSNAVSGKFAVKSLLALSKIFQAAIWIKKSQIAFLVICAGLIFDHVIRIFLTLNSEYYRIIDLPTWSFGIIGAGFSLIGIFIPTLASYLVKVQSLIFNFILLSLFCFFALLGLTYASPTWGLLPVGVIFCVMYLVGFMSSHYLNQETSSDIRATVLSFKGLAYNLAYGLAGLMYSFLAAKMKSNSNAKSWNSSIEIDNKQVFIDSLQYFPYYFLLVILFFLILLLFRMKKPNQPFCK